MQRGTKGDNLIVVLRVEFGRSVMESGEIVVPSEQPLGLEAAFEVAPQTQEGIEHLGMSAMPAARAGIHCEYQATSRLWCGFSR